MTISIGCPVFFVCLIFVMGMMFMALLLPGQEPDEDKKPTKIRHIAPDIENSLLQENKPDWKNSKAN
jgi:hypothetical protein